jgi:hypothetical protein
MMIKYFGSKIDGFTRVLPYAKKLKDFAIQLGWDGKKDEKGRKLLQLLGTEVARECISKNIWIDHWKKEADEYGEDIYIIDDVRFPNEINHINDWPGGFTIKIKGRKYDNVDSTHESEKELDDKKFNIIVNNNGTLDDLEIIAMTVVAEALETNNV